MSEIFDKLKLWAEKRSDILFLTLYGSFASDTFHSASDVDVAIASKSKISFEDKVSIINELTLLLKREIDLVDLRSANGVLLNQILTKGLVIKSHPEIQASQLKRMWFDHEDFEKQKNLDLQNRRKKIFNE